MNRLLLQIVTAVLAAIPVVTGLIGLSGLSNPLYASVAMPSSAVLDSNLRFFAGVWLGLGAALYWLIPRIESQTVLFRVIWAMIFLGGLGRVMSMILVAAPPLPFVCFTALEIAGAPIFVFWQMTVAV